MLNIVLYEPEMPMNTGNIGRSCVATNTRLHLIEPLGFKLNDKMVKRAGLDYWPHLDVTVYSDFKDFLEKNPARARYMRPRRRRSGIRTSSSGHSWAGSALPTTRGTRHCRRMLAYAMEQAKERGCDAVRFLVASCNIPAQRSYAKLNYEVCGECSEWEGHWLCYEKRLA